jgi:hypothetical protein
MVWAVKVSWSNSPKKYTALCPCGLRRGCGLAGSNVAEGMDIHLVCQCSETNMMHFSFNLLRIKGLYMFRALLVHPQEALHKQHLVYCVHIGLMSVSLQSWYSQLTLYARTIPSAVCTAPTEDEQVMLETSRGPWFSINWMKCASRWFHYTDILWCTFSKTFSSSHVLVTCCVGGGLCDELLTHSEDCYRLSVTVSDLETSILRRLSPKFGCCTTKKNCKVRMWMHQTNNKPVQRSRLGN